MHHVEKIQDMEVKYHIFLMSLHL